MRRLFDAPRDRDGEGRFLTGSVLLLLLLLISSLLHMAIDDYRHYSSFNDVFKTETATGSHASGHRFLPLDDGPFVMDGFKEFILARDGAKSSASKVPSNAVSTDAAHAAPALRDETLVLRGTVIPGFALFEYKPSMKQSVFQEGDKVFNRGTLLSVDTLSARVDIEGTVFTYRMGSNQASTHGPEKVAGETGDASKREMKKSPRARGGNDYANLSKRTGANEWELDSVQVDRITDDISSVINHVKISIYKEEGSARGYRISNIKPTGIFSKIGLKNGDVLLSINGYEVTSTTDLMKLMALIKIKGKMALTVDLIRAGKDKTLNYSII